MLERRPTTVRGGSITLARYGFYCNIPAPPDALAHKKAIMPGLLTSRTRGSNSERNP
jgi:hypothetical protein